MANSNYQEISNSSLLDNFNLSYYDISSSYIGNSNCNINDFNKTDNLSIYENNSNIIYNLDILDNDIYFYDTNIILNKYSYDINTDIDELKKKYWNITLIDLLPETKDLILNKFSLDKHKNKVYFLIIEYPSNDSQMATSDYYYKLYLENGTELNLSLIDEDFYATIYAPIRNLTLAKYNYSEYFIEQGYDIYSKNDKFYNDICSYAHYYDNDITLEDRKKEIFPNNVTLCKDNCHYKGFNIKNKNIICQCNLNSYTNYSLINKENFFVFEENGNFFDYFLDNINYKIFRCYKLIFNFKNLKKNIAFYTMISIIFLFIFINIKFYCCDVSKLKYLLLENSSINNNSNICIIKGNNK